MSDPMYSEQAMASNPSKLRWGFSLATDAVLLSAAAFVLFLLLREGGVGRATFQEWQDRREASKEVRANWDQLTARAPIVGSSQPDHVIVVFSDYECPFCRRAHEALKRYVQERPNAQLVMRHFPLSAIHPRAEGAALAAICADFQGAFGAMNEALMERDSWLEDGDFSSLANSVPGLNRKEFDNCLAGPDAPAVLKSDVELARRIRLNSTPSFVTREGVYSGTPMSPEALAELIGASGLDRQ